MKSPAHVVNGYRKAAAPTSAAPSSPCSGFRRAIRLVPSHVAIKPPPQDVQRLFLADIVVRLVVTLGDLVALFVNARWHALKKRPAELRWRKPIGGAVNHQQREGPIRRPRVGPRDGASELRAQPR